MAVTTINCAPAGTSTIGKTLFRVRDTSANASAGVEIVAAPAAGVRIYVTKVRFTTGSAITLALQDEDGNPIAGPYYFAANGPGMTEVFFDSPRYLVAAKALQWIASGAGNCGVECEGFSA